MQIHGVEVKGNLVDGQTRCSHYASQRDVIAIKFACCNTYYPCHSCHEEHANHPVKVWPAHAADEKAVLCGVCGRELTIREYLQSDSRCPSCDSPFNPGCSNHYHFYFDVPPK